MPQDGTLKVKLGDLLDTGGLNPDWYSFRSTYLGRDLLLVWWSAGGDETNNSVYGVMVDTSTGVPQIASGILTVGIADPPDGWSDVTSMGFDDEMTAFTVPGGGWVLTVTQYLYTGDGYATTTAVWLIDANGNLTDSSWTALRGLFSVGGRIWGWGYDTTNDVNRWTNLFLWDAGPITGGQLPPIPTLLTSSGITNSYLVGSGEYTVGTPIDDSEYAYGPDWVIIWQARQRSNNPTVFSALSLRFDGSGNITNDNLVMLTDPLIGGVPSVSQFLAPPLNDYVVGQFQEYSVSYTATSGGLDATRLGAERSMASQWAPTTARGYAVNNSYEIRVDGYATQNIPLSLPVNGYPWVSAGNGWDQVAILAAIEDDDYNVIEVRLILVSFTPNSYAVHYLTIADGDGIPGPGGGWKFAGITNTGGGTLNVFAGGGGSGGEVCDDLVPGAPGDTYYLVKAGGGTFGVDPTLPFTVTITLGSESEIPSATAGIYLGFLPDSDEAQMVATGGPWLPGDTLSVVFPGQESFNGYAYVRVDGVPLAGAGFYDHTSTGTVCQGTAGAGGESGMWELVPQSPPPPDPMWTSGGPTDFGVGTTLTVQVVFAEPVSIPELTVILAVFDFHDVTAVASGGPWASGATVTFTVSNPEGYAFDWLWVYNPATNYQYSLQSATVSYGVSGGATGWHTLDNYEPPPSGGTAGDGGVEAGWGHVSWMRSKAGGPGSGRTGRMKIKLS